MTEILYISGSLRKSSSSSSVVKSICQMVGNRAGVHLFDIGSIPHFNSDIEHCAEAEKLKELVSKVDAVVIVTPEYNYSIPGVLKNAIDWCSRPAYNSCFKDKPVFIVSVSAGSLGGVRAQSHLRYILSGLLAKTFAGPEITIGFSIKKTENGILEDENTLIFLNEEIDTFLSTVS